MVATQQQAPPAPAPTPRERVGAMAIAQSLMDRKLRMLEQLGTKELLRDLEVVDEAVVALVRERADLDVRIKAAKGALEEAETIAALNAPSEGKNEAARKLEREAALLKDPACQAARQTVRELEGQLIRLDGDLEANGRRCKRLVLEIQAKASALRFLGGDA